MTTHVLMPSYRGGRYLADALDSVLAQTTPDWHIFLLDTSGECRAAWVLAGYPDWFKAKVTFDTFPRLDDAGAHAHQRLLDLWAGDGYACWLHDDDAFHPDRIDSAVEYLDSHPDVDVAFSGHAHCDPDLNATGRVTYVTPEKWGWIRDTYRPVGMASAMLRGSAFEFTTLSPDQYVSGIQDVLMHARWRAAGLVVHSIPDTPHYLRRKHGGEYGNACAVTGSDMGMERLAPGVLHEESLRLDAALAELREEYK